jgi:hypothetical protein
VKVEPWRYRGPVDEEAGVEKAPKGNELFVLLAIRRGAKTLPMSPDFKLQEGDFAAVAVHTPEVDEARESLRRTGWEPQSENEAP